MANGQATAPQNEHSTSHTHMPTYSSGTSGAEPKIPGTAKVPSHADSALNASSTSETSSSTSISGANTSGATTESASKTWNFGEGNDSASSVNIPATGGTSSVSTPMAGKQTDRSQASAQRQPQQNGSRDDQEGKKTALGASQASTGKEGDRAERPAEDEGGAAKGEGANENENAYLNPLDKAKLVHLLARLPNTLSRIRKGDIARVTTFAITHASRGADEIVDLIVSNVQKPLTFTSANSECQPVEGR